MAPVAGAADAGGSTGGVRIEHTRDGAVGIRHGEERLRSRGGAEGPELSAGRASRAWHLPRPWAYGTRSVHVERLTTRLGRGSTRGAEGKAAPELVEAGNEKEDTVTVPEVDPQRARSLVERAAERFKVGEYTQANRLLDEAERAGPDEFVHEEIDRGRSALQEQGFQPPPTDVEHGTADAAAPSSQDLADTESLSAQTPAGGAAEPGEQVDTGTGPGADSSRPGKLPVQQDLSEQVTLFDAPATPDDSTPATTKRSRQQRRATSATSVARQDFEQDVLFATTARSTAAEPPPPKS